MDFVKYMSNLATRRLWTAGEQLLLDALLLTSFAGRSLEGWRKVDLERVLEAMMNKVSRDRSRTRVHMSRRDNMSGHDFSQIAHNVAKCYEA